jgi:hypothetical protein
MTLAELREWHQHQVDKALAQFNRHKTASKRLHQTAAQRKAHVIARRRARRLAIFHSAAVNALVSA